MIALLASIGRRLTEGLRVLNPSIGVRVPAPELSSEVYDERQKMSASAYVAHLKEAMAGTADPKERLAWSKYLVGMYLREPDAYNAFFWDVDALIAQGELVHVLTPEEVEQVQQRVLDNIEHWREEASRIGKDYGIAPEAMQRFLSGDQDITEEDLLAIDDDEVDVWAEDEDEASDCGVPQEASGAGVDAEALPNAAGRDADLVNGSGEGTEPGPV